jgi:hypothetical protein
MKPLHENLAAAFLVLIFVFLSITSSLKKSATVEEFSQIPAGLYAWKTNDFSLYEEVPPISSMFATLPLRLMKVDLDTDPTGYPEGAFRAALYGTDFMWNNLESYDWILLVSRLAIIFSGVFVCLIVWRTAREGFSEWGGLLSLACCALSPTLIAHTRLVSADVMASLFSIIFLITLIEYFEEPKFIAALKIAVALGFAISTKFSCLIWLIFALAAPPISALTYLTESVRRPGLFRAAFHFSTIVVFAWSVIVCSYFCMDVGFHRDIDLESRTMKAAAPLVGVIPLPGSFISGLDKSLNEDKPDAWSRGTYLNGEWREGGRWDYYFFAAVFKEPITHMALFLIVVFLIVGSRHRDRDETLLFVAIMVFFVMESLFESTQDGIRNLLPVYPAAFILMGKLASIAFEPFATVPDRIDFKPVPIKTWRKVARVCQKVLLILICVWMPLQHVLIWPDYIPYFNLGAQRLERREYLLLDSNLDWGQDLPGLARWMKKNETQGIDLAYFGHDDPERHGIKFSLPARGSANESIAISGNLLMGKKYPMTFLNEEIKSDDPLWPELERYRNEAPLKMIGHSIFVFNKLQ